MLLFQASNCSGDTANTTHSGESESVPDTEPVPPTQNTGNDSITDTEPDLLAQKTGNDSFPELEVCIADLYLIDSM